MTPSEGERITLLKPVRADRDHIRGGAPGSGSATLVIYGDYLCPYCRRLRSIIDRLREALGDRLAYVYRHHPNERAHPGATFAAIAAEAAGRQGRFWPMHDELFSRPPPLAREDVLEAARSVGLDMARFTRDLDDPALERLVEEDLADGTENSVTVTPTIFVDGQRYDGAWDFYSLLEALERPVGATMRRTARAFANLPASAGLVLLIAAAIALGLANSPFASAYRHVVNARLGLSGDAGALSLTVAEWCSDGLLTIFFLLVGLEIRREMTAGALTDRRAAMLPFLCAVGGTLAPAAIYLAINHGPLAAGWSTPTATGIAFALGLLAVLGSRAPVGLKVFVAALAVVDDIISVGILAVFYPKDFHPAWLIAGAAGIGAMSVLNRWRVYSGWPYLLATLFLWLTLQRAGIDASLAGVVLAIFLPTRPAPAAGPLLAQAATALAALEHASTDATRATRGETALQGEPIWDSASRNLSAAAARLLSPADRVERAAGPWSAYLILPLFAFSATGVSLRVDFGSSDASRILIGVMVGLIVGKPLGVCLMAFAAVKAKLAVMPDDTPVRAFFGGALLCGVSDPVALLMADLAFPHGEFATVAKIGVLAGSAVAAALGWVVLATSPPPVTRDGRSAGGLD